MASVPQCDEEEQLVPAKLRSEHASVSGGGNAFSMRQRLFYAGQIVLFTIIIVQSIMLYRSFAISAPGGNLVDADLSRKPESFASSSSNLPDYYQTKPELYARYHMGSTDEKLTCAQLSWANPNWRPPIPS